MKKLFFATALAAGIFHMDADALKVQPDILDTAKPVTVTLTLDKPADSACLELRAYQRPFQLNGSDRIALKPSADRKTFQAQFPAETFYHPVYATGRNNGGSALEAVPVVVRNGAEIRLKAAKPWKLIRTFPLPMKANAVKGCDGKFGRGLAFDGKDAMAAVNRMRFHAERGTIEGWFFLPLLLKKGSSILCFIQSADGSPWRYHQLSVPANSRKVQYLTYNGQPKNAVSIITSKEIASEDWIHIMATYDLSAKKMELFINGESQGSAPYTVPCGGKTADLNIGARIHNTGNTYQFIGGCQMMLDDLRISDTVRPAAMPEKALANDANTLLLLGCDGADVMK